MKCLNKRSKSTIQKLYKSMYNPKYMIEEGSYAKINNNPLYMEVVVEKIGYLPTYGEVISIPHYGTQNGDPMRDQDMTFCIIDGDYYPISYRNDYLGLFQEVIIGSKINLKLQRSLTTFANQWLRNIKSQQGL